MPRTIERLIDTGQVLRGCARLPLAETPSCLFQSGFRHGIGLRINDEVNLDTLFVNASDLSPSRWRPERSFRNRENIHVVEPGETIDEYAIIAGGETVRLAVLQEAWEHEDLA